MVQNSMSRFEKSRRISSSSNTASFTIGDAAVATAADTGLDSSFACCGTG